MLTYHAIVSAALPRLAAIVVLQAPDLLTMPKLT